ncbi:hypothetical protein ACFO5X_04335 [Seohaeicola nanhaiensis]|uniref:Bro-N domain-containing protein n=1 Tax=Seohaeicola nanhaiensis TaxID=1387282 RepID=A0ABV9KCE7_9RHOB
MTDVTPPPVADVAIKLRRSKDFEILARVICMNGEMPSVALATQDFGALIRKKRISNAEFNKFTAMARADARMFDGLNFTLAVRFSCADMPMTALMRSWISDVLMREEIRPKSKGGRYKRLSEMHNYSFVQLVSMAMKFGLKATRSSATRPSSACDAVVIALADFGHHVTYDAVAKHWSKRAENSI